MNIIERIMAYAAIGATLMIGGCPGKAPTTAEKAPAKMVEAPVPFAWIPGSTKNAIIREVDVDGDGDLDLICANSNIDYIWNDGQPEGDYTWRTWMYRFENDGKGNYTPMDTMMVPEDEAD